MGGDTPVSNAKNILEVPSDTGQSDFPFNSIPFHLAKLELCYEKSAKCNPTFWWDNFFSHPLEILTSQ